MAYYPVYGQLVSFGSVLFDEYTAYFTSLPQAFNIQTVYLLGQSYPVDRLNGGVPPFQSTLLVCQWFASASDAQILSDPTGATAATAVEAKIRQLQALVRSVNTDGTSGSRQSLTVKMADGTVVSAPASYVSHPIDANARAFSMLNTPLTFQLWGDFT